MKIAVVGAGAIGGLPGRQAGACRQEVTFIARNRNLQAINAQGFRLIWKTAARTLTGGILVRAVQRWPTPARRTWCC
jgi:2-dehydropantoate 2-reductase